MHTSTSDALIQTHAKLPRMNKYNDIKAEKCSWFNYAAYNHSCAKGFQGTVPYMITSLHGHLT